MILYFTTLTPRGGCVIAHLPLLICTFLPQLIQFMVWMHVLENDLLPLRIILLQLLHNQRHDPCTKQ